MRITLIVLFGICLTFSSADAYVRGYANQGRVAVGNRNRNQNVNVNRNANVNRNVNVNNNVNVNRNVNVHGGYNGGGCCYYHDDPNWGAFAAGAAVGVATTAVVAAATRPKETTVVVQAPPVGSAVGVLPGGCSTVSAGGAVIYNCNSVYYRPFYQGTSLVYQVVTYP
jgi:outer membrane usher protein FimD/PapC